MIWRGLEIPCENGKLAAVIEDASLNEAHKDLTIFFIFLHSEGQKQLTTRCFTKSACSCRSDHAGLYLDENTVDEVKYSKCNSICVREVLKHPETVLQALKQDISISSFVDNEVRRTDKFATFFLEAFKKDPEALKYVPQGSVNDRDIISSAIPILGGYVCLKAAHTQILNRELVRDALQSEGLALMWAANFNRDEELVKLALDQNVLSLVHASTDLMSSEAFMRDTSKRRGDKGAVVAACKQDGFLLKWATKKLRRSRQVVLAAASMSGEALKYAPRELQNDKAFVKVLLTENGHAFQYVSDELKNDPTIALLAMSTNSDAWTFVSSSLKNHNKEVILAGIAAGKMCFSPFFQPVPSEMMNDRDIAMASVEKCGTSIRLFDSSIQNDRGVSMAAVIQNGDTLIFCAEQFKNEKAFVKCAMDSSPKALQWASGALKGDRELAMLALKGGLSIIYISPDLHDDRELALVAVSQPRSMYTVLNSCLKYVSARLQADSDVVMTSVTNNGNSLEHASHDLRNNREIVFAAVFQSKDAFQYTSFKREFQEWVESEIGTNAAYRLLLSATNNEAPIQCSSLCGGSLIEQMNCGTLSVSSVESQLEIEKLRALIKRMMMVGPRLTCAVPPFVCQLFRLKGNSDVHRSIAEFAGVKTGQRLHQLRIVRKHIQLQ